ncbi:MAG TPA: ATP-dependent Clp protease ATP-binding subunit ClpC [Cyanobacteria bacterium UBA11149]|nr:ATP-dependent Clp protease ATP-binding subunit ClpC [Cyanobacteria bacterium UBA11367]HBE60976.1 ATP-dependent Clp protease ATP-binding subunit ClpC [Cyanobacteria bacterium UBA11366]HBK65872.1 ATP-dependent Clp protease ATP-binding subunit ClpC [Cyanobacteria bacterium UBA11166]HBR72456.1 ATP-dependent Clp protease ATP-binding subunit ClpC [Cyanobacteria bacterium UBA11159]HBS69403.1 ATP-dependent Clp protease ATP-binding subunit ClpC [Cyanobacteria bacterium UBA11153]HBW90289.1 ATP-depend
MFEHFTDRGIKAIMLAQEEARRLGHNLVGTEQILLGLISEGTSIAAILLKELGVTLETTRKLVAQIIGRGSGVVPVEIPFTPKAKRLFETAFQEARQLANNYIGPEHLFLAILQDQDSVAGKVLQHLGVDPDSTRTKVIQSIGEVVATTTSRGVGDPLMGGNSSTATLEQFGTNLTRLAAEGKLDPVVGRVKEIERVVQILGRRTKNNPLLIGEPGVGKTAIAEGLAQRIVDQNIPDILVDKQVINLDMGALLAGTRFRGEFEERLKQIMEEVRQSGNIILVIDEVHTLIGAGATQGTMDAANMLKPALARGELQCLGATTLDEYRKHIEGDAALERRFQPVMVGEPSVDETISILYGLRDTYEQYHKVQISDLAIEAAAKLSDRYISDRFLPDKAIDLIDEAGSRVHLMYSQISPGTKELKKELRQATKEKEDAVRVQDFEQAAKLRDRELQLEARLRSITPTSEVRGEGGQGRQGRMFSSLPTSYANLPIVDEEDIAQIVSSWMGIPVNKLTESESAMLLHIEETLHQRIIGQNEAVTAVSQAIRRARVGLKNPNRPIASLIFSGPTGVGKTELTKALAAYMFGAEDAMIRLDMSEFMEPHTVSKLIGSPPGFVGYDEGGQLTEAVRRKPYSVVLFDEIEKAHPDVFNILLQLLDDGRLTDAKGRVVDFKNTLIIMTSNIGSKAIEKGGSGFGFQSEENMAESRYKYIRDRVNEELKQSFRPEFLNRLDDIIVFRQLVKEEIKQIADLLLQEVSIRLLEQGITLEVTERFKERLIAEGYDPNYGARPLRRAIMRLVEDKLAEAMLVGKVNEGDTAIIDVNNDGEVTVLSSLDRELFLETVG